MAIDSKSNTKFRLTSSRNPILRIYPKEFNQIIKSINMNKLSIVMSITEGEKNWKQHTCYGPVISQLESKQSPGLPSGNRTRGLWSWSYRAKEQVHAQHELKPAVSNGWQQEGQSRRWNKSWAEQKKWRKVREDENESKLLLLRLDNGNMSPLGKSWHLIKTALVLCTKSFLLCGFVPLGTSLILHSKYMYNQKKKCYF